MIAIFLLSANACKTNPAPTKAEEVVPKSAPVNAVGGKVAPSVTTVPEAATGQPLPPRSAIARDEIDAFWKLHRPAFKEKQLQQVIAITHFPFVVKNNGNIGEAKRSIDENAFAEFWRAMMADGMENLTEKPLALADKKGLPSLQGIADLATVYAVEYQGNLGDTRLFFGRLEDRIQLLGFEYAESGD